MKKLTYLPGLSAGRNVKRFSYSTAMLVLLVFTLISSSCRKKEEAPQPQPDTEQATAADNNLAEGTAADIDAMGSQASENNELSTFRTSGNVSATNVLTIAPCATVTAAPAARMFTVDFGTSCVGMDGRTRSGKLIYDCSASATNALYYRNPGFVMNVTSQNYVVNGNQVNIISKKVTNTTPSNIPSTPAPGINLTWSVVSNISIAKAGGGNITWSCNRTKELVNTNDTTCYRGQSLHIIWTKAIVKLNGTASGTNAQNETYTAVASNVVRDFNCAPDVAHPHRHPFISGSVTYTPGSRPVRVINYGSGSCDLVATLTINNQTYTITLP